MTDLQKLLTTYRQASASEREKGTYFEDLICTYLRNEATYRDLYDHVWTYADWAREQKIDARDTGIDLVARTQGTGEYHAIQCKFYADDYRVQKGDIDSFFTASGKKRFHTGSSSRPQTIGASTLTTRCKTSTRQSARSTCTI